MEISKFTNLYTYVCMCECVCVYVNEENILVQIGI